ncbi:MAG: hypothetical protein P8R46_11190, partial [Planctomycetota bacterium]|nr:hypothetical protein [Planctomycetota bacterium]
GRDPSSLWISIWPSGDRVLPVDRRPKGASPEADGSFELTGLRPGSDYILTLHSDRSATRRRGTGGERATASAGDRDVRLEWAPRATVRGRVVQRSGESSGAVPVEGFVLWHTLSPPKSDDFRGAALEVDGEVAASHADGRFVIDGLRIEPGSTRAMALRVRAPGFEQLVRTGIPVPHGVEVDLGEIELAPAPGLRVRVVEAGTQRPVEGARVFLAEETERKSLGRWRLRDTPAHASTKTRFAETDASGHAVLQLPKKRPLILFANADGFPAGEFLEVSGEEEVVLELNRGATVAAEVVDMNGNALEGVEVSMRSQRVEGGSGSPRRVARTDELGVALFEHVEAGVATVRVEPPRMRPRQPKGWRESSERVDVTEGEEVGVRLVMPMSSEVFGRVRLGGAPLPDARVRFAVMEGGELLRSETTSGSLRAITDQGGEFSLRGVPTGTFEVTVSHRSRSMATVFTYEVRSDRSELIIELVETRVSGRVVAAETGEPVRGVTVLVAGPSSLHRAWVGQRSMRENWQGGMDFSDDWIEPGKVVTGEDGTFQFSGITPGVSIELTASGELVRGNTEALGAFEDGEVREGVVLEVAAAATLRVFGENVDRRRRSRSSRLLDYGIRLRALEGRMRPKVVKSFRGSSYKFSSLRPGRYSVETIDLKAEGYPAIEVREVTLGGGEQAEITMPGL